MAKPKKDQKKVATKEERLPPPEVLRWLKERGMKITKKTVKKATLAVNKPDKIRYRVIFNRLLDMYRIVPAMQRTPDGWLVIEASLTTLSNQEAKDLVAKLAAKKVYFVVVKSMSKAPAMELYRVIPSMAVVPKGWAVVNPRLVNFADSEGPLPHKHAKALRASLTNKILLKQGKQPIPVSRVG